jgi:hypothetical protein
MLITQQAASYLYITVFFKNGSVNDNKIDVLLCMCLHVYPGCIKQRIFGTGKKHGSLRQKAGRRQRQDGNWERGLRHLKLD